MKCDVSQITEPGDEQAEQAAQPPPDREPRLRARQAPKPRAKRQGGKRSRWLFTGRARSSMPPLRGALEESEGDGDRETDPLEELRAIMMVDRRRRLARVVTACVAFSVAICLAAVVRVRTSGGSSRVGTGVVAAATATAPAGSGSGTGTEDTDEERGVPEPAPTSSAAVKAVQSAIDIREAARGLFERGKIDEAVDVASRALELDATDAEAWLILGAAQQAAGDIAGARATFGACTQQARRGPLAECWALLQ